MKDCHCKNKKGRPSCSSRPCLPPALRQELKELAQGIVRLEDGNFTKKIWGGDWIVSLKGSKGKKEKIGESWEFSGLPELPNVIKLKGGKGISLDKLIQLFPRDILGDVVFKRCGARSPILLKFIDAKENLSLQVHPPTPYALKHENQSGKSEAWYILDTGPAPDDGIIYLGFNKGAAADTKDGEEFKNAFFDAIEQANDIGPTVTAQKLSQAASLVLPFVNKIRVNPGDVYMLPPGTIHSIGKGVRLFEIQQSSSLTYRVWDWNRVDPDGSRPGKPCSRELHVEKAMDVLDFAPKTPDELMFSPEEKPTPQPSIENEVIIQDPIGKFCAELLSFDEKGCELIQDTGGLFAVLTVIEGEVTVAPRASAKSAFGKSVHVRRGFTVLIPASVAQFKIESLSPQAQLIQSSAWER